MGETFYLSIVGCGARGLHALERFYSSLSRKRDFQNLKTRIFETNNTLGTGLAWDPAQTEVNWSNISDRALEPLKGRPAFQIKDLHFPAFPSYLDWLDEVMDVQIHPDKDTFSRRKVTGAYLAQRAQTIIEPLQSLGLLEVHKKRIISLSKTDSVFSLTTQDGLVYESSQVILALGHLSTTPSNENKKFAFHAASNDLHFCAAPYSDNAKEIYADSKSFIVKGLGLAMIDTVRMILENHQASFEEIDGSIFLKYIGNTDVEIVPYSLDGLAMVPKPVGKNIDDYFDPTNAGKQEMLTQLHADLKARKIKTIDDILNPIAGIAIKIYNGFEKSYTGDALELEEGKNLIVAWLKDPSVKNKHIINTSMPIVDYMRLTCLMSHDQYAFSLDYTIGQVWRELQIDMYYLFTYDLLPSKLVAEFIQVNEMAKRYSFGPPVDSILQIIALENAGVLNLDYANDPKIRLIEKGFEISKDNCSMICKALVDSVLSKPNLAQIEDPLVESLIKVPIAEQFEEHLGIRVTNAATHLLGSNPIKGLYSIGRNAKGSAHGVDALLECFVDDKMQAVVDEVLSNRS